MSISIFGFVRCCSEDKIPLKLCHKTNWNLSHRSSPDFPKVAAQEAALTCKTSAVKEKKKKM